MKTTMPKIGAVIQAAGRGTRMGYKRNKLMMPLQGLPVLTWTLRGLVTCPYIQSFVIVIRPEDEEEVRESILPAVFTQGQEVRLVYGGESREASTWNGLMTLPEDIDIVISHDGARPFVSSNLIERCINRLRDLGQQRASGVICVVPVKDTIKVVGEAGYVQATPPRKNLYAVQTPQVFWMDHLVWAYRKAQTEKVAVTDDAGIVEIVGGRIATVEGSYNNIKITTPEDLSTAELILRELEK